MKNALQVIKSVLTVIGLFALGGFGAGFITGGGLGLSVRLQN